MHFFVRICQYGIRVDVLNVTLVGDFIDCLRGKVLQDSRYFFVSDYCFDMHFIQCQTSRSISESVSDFSNMSRTIPNMYTYHIPK